ncbi:MAG: LytTR family DNA-binding domain-containing protein [Ekhidna sp.]|uniref:LytTR family DNA-binding domain-containing protein n=1 Tax=Ekhidna sp. TaxID=2608089 RepID=UPI0032EAFA4D
MTFTKSYKVHLAVGVGVSTWLFFFLVFIAPFDVSDLSFFIRMQITIVYGLIFFLCYVISIFIQNMLFGISSKWSVKLELLIYLLLYLLAMPFTIWYYKSDIVNGDYSISRFILEQYIPILIIITPIMFLLRKLAAKSEKVISHEKGLITLKGENKTDILRLKSESIISANSSDNYVEVCYLDQGELKKKLLRTTLKKVESECDFLVRTHRSFLFNPNHFIEWISKDILRLTQIEIPVSKQYKDRINQLIRP